MKKFTKLIIAIIIITMPFIAGCRTKQQSAAVPSDQSSRTEQGTTVILHTTAGDISIELDTQNMPMTTSNFLTLSKKNFYNDTVFHRVIKGFMIQGGDPKGDGTGGPGYTFPDEPFQGEYTRGTVAMANSGPNTNGSQFFIMHKDYPLPKQYVIFGHVTAGLDVVDKIATAKVTANDIGEESKPVKPIRIESVEVVEK